MENQAPPRKTTKILESVWTLVVGILVAGPFALPLLWRNPRFSKTTKVWVSVLVILFTGFLLYIGGTVLNELNEELKRLNEIG